MKILLLLLFVQLPLISADTPVHCLYEQVVGDWILHVGTGGHDNKVQCQDSLDQEATQLHVTLDYPDLAYDEFGNQGFWTMIYDEGFELVVNRRKYFAFLLYKVVNSTHVDSICNKTFVGWSHDVLSRDWACYWAEKATSSSKPSQSSLRNDLAFSPRSTKLPNQNPTILKAGNYRHRLMGELHYKPNPKFVANINAVQNSWTATLYPQFEGRTLGQLFNMRGGFQSKYGRPSVKPQELPAHLVTAAASLPETWDWRNVKGVNYVSPVRDQGACGSCYAFSSAAMLESRIRIATNNQKTPVLSPQDIVGCCEYSQGCDGGFPYLVAGKYGEDFGWVAEAANPYTGKNDPKCQTNSTATRYYATDYRYVGGYYGACNEQLMKIALVHDGPMTVSFEVYDDFMHYKNGVYHHVAGNDELNNPVQRLHLGEAEYNPFEITNHAVLLVGYGTDAASGENYWLVKNSWSTNWGEDGYFRIRRGMDECSIESMAEESFPVI